jgi:hypothetical protein
MRKKPVYIDHVGWIGSTPLFVLRYCESKLRVKGCKASLLARVESLAQKLKNPVAYENQSKVMYEAWLRHEHTIRKIARG